MSDKVYVYVSFWFREGRKHKKHLYLLETTKAKILTWKLMNRFTGDVYRDVYIDVKKIRASEEDTLFTVYKLNYKNCDSFNRTIYELQQAGEIVGNYRQLENLLK